MKIVLCNSKSEGRAEGRAQRKWENNRQISHHREDGNICPRILVYFQSKHAACLGA